MQISPGNFTKFWKELSQEHGRLVECEFKNHKI